MYKRRLSTEARIGNIGIGGENPIRIQSMATVDTNDTEGCVAQAKRIIDAGGELVRFTTQGTREAENMKNISARLKAEGYNQPLVADVHFTAHTADVAALYCEKVRINPGNYVDPGRTFKHLEYTDEEYAAELEKIERQLVPFLNICKEHHTAVRIGVNHGSLSDRIMSRYGDTPEGIVESCLEFLRIFKREQFNDVVISIKASNTVVMVQAYRELARMMQESGVVFPLHVGVTEAGNGDSGRIKSCVAISTLLQEGIGNTIRVSLTEDPANEIPVARYLANRYGIKSPHPGLDPGSPEEASLKAACDWGAPLLNHEVDDIPLEDEYLKDEILQACRRRFYKPEYIACPGCGRTLYDLENTFNKVKVATAGFKDVVIAVMGCIVNGPGEMADADYGYVGEGAGKVTLYRKKEPVLRHIPEDEAVNKLVELITADSVSPLGD